MAIVLSQADYWSLFQQAPVGQDQYSDDFDVTWNYPTQLGHGFWRVVHLREGVKLEIGNYRLHQSVVVEAIDRQHPVEYSFCAVAEHSNPSPGTSIGECLFSGSGLALADNCEYAAGEHFFEVNIHIEPEQFQASISADKDTPSAFQSLLKSVDQERTTYSGIPTAAMQMILQQILHCPYQGCIKRMYLESKVWELIALQLDIVLQPQLTSDRSWELHTDDIDRIHHAREILAQHLDNPPSLKTLARQVGLNEFALKQGFRKVLGTTAFGYLHQYRMERARQLLEAGEMSITQVARAVGFANRGYFAAAFRKQFGINPKLYSTVTRQAQ